ncbi:lipid IV(A) 3-deoxy-D-manno-octulosonic acid transferase [Pleionea sp. CnH1-48]|uniref:lipid IV(A) 3-deoxy-D-manno-octulosonic acid transferase n=1 Tax=Pleionea sp. CnH1-48 TaxID=2954494 RepID=UPI002096B82C|nr:lipid IV(A) 3-deoxy-D-manno-octulosonic acid transferase [Pleionea sp. CnH1-48]
MARWIYSIIFFLAVPFVLLNLYFKGRDIPAYRKRWREHFAIFNNPKLKGSIWVHAVSVGEVFAAVPIIRRLQQLYPDCPITVTTTTPTGSERVQASFGESVFHVYSPYDLPRVVKRFLNKIQPRMVIIMETELWPNLIHYSRKYKVPVCVVNARLSSRSAHGYARLPIPTKKMILDPVSHFACQHESDASRFIELGAEAERVSVTGSVKFDLPIPDNLESLAREMFGGWSEQDFVWVAGSTHAGEDELILKAHKELVSAGICARLILVPRHPERFESVSELIEQRGFRLARRSRGESANSEVEVFLCDSMGELLYCYQAADVAFVGGSLIERGGHNPLEPAALSKPVLTGKHVFNFADVYKNMLSANAALEVSESNLAEVLRDLYENKTKLKQMGKAGLGVVASNRGAINRTLKILERYLEENDQNFEE